MPLASKGSNGPILILETLRGDPILCISLNSRGCCGGSALGRVSLYLFHNQFPATAYTPYNKPSVAASVIKGETAVTTTVPPPKTPVPTLPIVPVVIGNGLYPQLTQGIPNFENSGNTAHQEFVEDPKSTVSTVLNTHTETNGKSFLTAPSGTNGYIEKALRNGESSPEHPLQESPVSNSYGSPYSHSDSTDANVVVQTHKPLFSSSVKAYLAEQEKSLSQPSSSSSNVGLVKDAAIPGTYIVLSAYSLEAVKSVYLSATSAYAVLNNCQYRSWDLETFECRVITQLDWRLATCWKYFAQHEDTFLIATPQKSLIVNVVNERQAYAGFRITDRDMCLLDYNGAHALCLIKEPKKGQKLLRIASITDSSAYYSRVASAGVVFELQFASIAKFISTACFWEPNRIAIVCDGRKIVIYNYREKKLIQTFKGHKNDIVAINGSQPETLVSVSRDRLMRVWDIRYRKSILCKDCRPASFALGWPYCIKRFGSLVAFSSDEVSVLIEYRVVRLNSARVKEW